MSKRAEITNIWLIIIVVAIIGFFLTIIILNGNSLMTSTTAILDNDSEVYILQLNGINLDDFNNTAGDLEYNPALSDNGSGNPKDYALDFFFGKEQSLEVSPITKQIFSYPSLLLVDVLRLPLNDWRWAIDWIVWILKFAGLVALVYFIRNR